MNVRCAEFAVSCKLGNTDFAPAKSGVGIGLSELKRRTSRPAAFFIRSARASHVMAGRAGAPSGAPVSFGPVDQPRSVRLLMIGLVRRRNLIRHQTRFTMQTLILGTTSIRQLDGLFSLNDLHIASGGAAKHRPNQFLRIDQTKGLIAEIDKCADMRSLKTVAGRNGGTYACRELVIAYAAWISAAFHLKVIQVFLAAINSAPAPAPVDPYRVATELFCKLATELGRGAVVAVLAQFNADHLHRIPVGKLPALESTCKKVLKAAAPKALPRPTPKALPVPTQNPQARWKDPKTVERLLKSMRFRNDSIYSCEGFVTPDDAAQWRRDGRIGPRRWAKLEQHVVWGQP